MGLVIVITGLQSHALSCPYRPALPPAPADPSPQHALQAPGLVTVLDTQDCGCWESSVAQTLGHHSSELLSPAQPFKAHFRMGRVGPFSILHLQGRGRLRLKHEQRVLWLPLQGITEERINGQTRLRRLGLDQDPADAA